MTRAPLILICDHRGEGLLERVQPLASGGMRLEVSQSLTQTRKILANARPDVVLIDPLARGGVVELQQVEQVSGKGPLALLLIADADDPSPTLAVSQSLRLSTWDLIYREAPLEEYVMRIERLRTQMDRLAELAEVRYRAVHDDHTALLRPHAFQARLREHFSAAHRHHFDLALVLVDLDDFGRVNKDHDHTVGDNVIARVGEVIRDCLRAEDVGGRLGGDEFGIAIPYTSRIDAARVVNRLRDQIHALSGHIEGARRDVRVSASLGFETFDGTDLDSVEELRRHAEIALRKAKRAGGNRGVFYRGLAGESSHAAPTGQPGPPGRPGPDPSGSAHKDRA